MPLEEITLRHKPGKIPKRINAMLIEADKRCDAFFAAGLGRRYPRYLPSDPTVFFQSVLHLKETGKLRGNVFCEWGCGFGIASCITSLLGFESYGIEIEPEIADLANQLAGDLDIPVEILCTSYLPEGYEECEGIGGKDLLPPAATTSHDITPMYEDLDPAEVDLFFVYPWPDQEQLMMDLFESVATEEAVLLIYLENGEMAAFRRGIDEE